MSWEEETQDGEQWSSWCIRVIIVCCTLLAAHLQNIWIIEQDFLLFDLLLTNCLIASINNFNNILVLLCIYYQKLFYSITCIRDWEYIHIQVIWELRPLRLWRCFLPRHLWYSTVWDINITHTFTQPFPPILIKIRVHFLCLRKNFYDIKIQFHNLNVTWCLIPLKCFHLVLNFSRVEGGLAQRIKLI